MSDPFKALRDALLAGPTPGPWEVDEDDRPGMSWNRHIMSSPDTAVCFMAHSGGVDAKRDEATARLIAACDPATIRALLDRVNALEDALREISMAGMSLPMEACGDEDAKDRFHARQAWNFIGIAGRALRHPAISIPTTGEKS